MTFFFFKSKQPPKGCRLSLTKLLWRLVQKWSGMFLPKFPPNPRMAHKNNSWGRAGSHFWCSFSSPLDFKWLQFSFRKLICPQRTICHNLEFLSESPQFWGNFQSVVRKVFWARKFHVDERVTSHGEDINGKHSLRIQMQMFLQREAFKKYKYVLIFGCTVSLSLPVGFLSCGEQGLLSGRTAGASHCNAFSCCGRGL